MNDFIRNISDDVFEAIAGYYSNELTQEQADLLLDWLAKDQTNRNLFEELGETWRITWSIGKKDFNIEKALITARNRIKENALREWPEHHINIRLFKFYKLVAGILLFTSLGIAAYLILKTERQKVADLSYYEASAPKGSTSHIVMPDGTNIWLNADTKIKYTSEFGISNRNVYLEGEAYFKVVKNKNLTFQVITTDVIVKAIGTSFNVKSYKDEPDIETTLEEGVLQVEPVTASKGLKGIAPVILKPNQNATFIKNALSEGKLEISEVSDTRIYTAWKDNKWIIKNEKISALVPILERRYNVNIIFVDQAIKDFVITATLFEEPLEQVLQAIGLSTPVLFKVKSKNVYLYENHELMNRYKEILKP